jgi:hypothetical protein
MILPLATSERSLSTQLRAFPTIGPSGSRPRARCRSFPSSPAASCENASRTFVFEFVLKDGVLKGKYTGAAGSVEMEGLTFENNIVRFSVTVSGMELEYSAIIDGDKLTGQDTGESILSGVLNGALAEVTGIIGMYKKKYPDIRIILTGGNANYFEKR